MNLVVLMAMALLGGLGWRIGSQWGLFGAIAGAVLGVIAAVPATALPIMLVLWLTGAFEKTQ